MSRWRVSPALLGVALAFNVVLYAQQPVAPKAPPTAQPEEDVQLPPEEDKAQIPKEYSFNPVQSQKEAVVGEFYFKKRDFKAAVGRFREATKWNEGNADAWLRLGDAQEKMKDSKAAHEAWDKYLQLAPDGKSATEVRKKLAKLKD